MFVITPEPLSPDPLVRAVSLPGAGGVSVFHGIVRGNNLGRTVLFLEYEAFPELCETVLAGIEAELRERWPVVGFAVAHRTGRIEIGEPSLLVAVSTAHRREAFEACHWAVDRIKERMPVWKKEHFEGGETWIEGDPTGSATPV
jgi:molybdopterin synthase catalytic subunit